MIEAMSTSSFQNASKEVCWRFEDFFVAELLSGDICKIVTNTKKQEQEQKQGNKPN